MRQGHAACWVCGEYLPGALVHEHHKAPRAAGGGDERGNLCVICPLCHTAVHQATRYFVKGNISQAKDLAHQLARGDREITARLLELVTAEARAWKEGKKSDLQRVTFELERGVYEALKGIAKNMPGKVGVGRLMRTVVTSWLKSYVRKDVLRKPKIEVKRSRPEVKP